MTDILINALSVTNQSGLHVLAGHMDLLVEKFRVVVVARPSMTHLRERFAGRVEWINAPEKTARWLPRAIWEFQTLEKTARRVGARFYFTPSGIAASRLSIPQVVLCQNPWAMVPSARHRRDFLKAWLQRRAYRKTMRRAAVMVFNSKYMQQVYRENAGFQEACGIIATQAADQETRERSNHWKNRPRNAGQILCVSAMAPHKNVEALLRAIKKLIEDHPPRLAATPPVEGTQKRAESKPPPMEGCRNGGVGSSGCSCKPCLHLVGSWPDSVYEQQIRSLVLELGLSEQVHFDGFVSREELDRLYAESQVFCLMSRCESFGIPAIEAQLFGTPVVCSNVCAVPEICGEGGLFCDPDDADGIASALASLLNDSNHWKTISEKARVNADRFVWETCSQPLADVLMSGEMCA